MRKTYYRRSSHKVAQLARELYFVGKLKQREICRILEISQPTASRMISGQSWTKRTM